MCIRDRYGNVPGFGYVTEDGRTGWDTVYGLTRALQVELGITSPVSYTHLDVYKRQLQHILPGRFEVLGVPRVCHSAGMGGVVHQEGHLAGIVAAADAVHIPEVGLVHADQELSLIHISMQSMSAASRK